MTHFDISPLSRAVARLDRIQSGVPDTSMVPTGFPSLDRVLGGGMARGELIVVGGDDGAGTSSLAMAIAIRASSLMSAEQPSGGPSSLLLTGEMLAERGYERALAIEGRVRPEELHAGTLGEVERAHVAAAALRLRAHAPLIETLGREGIGSVARAIESTRSARLVVVDGLESLLISPEQRDDQLAYLVLALKRLALDAQVALLVTSHLPLLDRTRADRRPLLADFGARGAIGAHADTVLAIYREEMYQPDLALQGATELVLLKRRNGALGYLDLYFYASWLRFEDVAEG